MVNCINLIIEMSPRFVLGRENVPRVAEVVNGSLKADCTDFSLVYTDSKKTSSCLLPRHAIFATFGRQIKMPTCTHTGRFISVHYVLDNLSWLVFVFLSNLIINLMYNTKKLYLNDQHKFRV